MAVIFRYINGKIRPIQVDEEQTTNEYMNKKIRSNKKTLEQQRKELSEKYKEYLRYPIQRMRVRKWYEAGPNTGHGKGIKYDISYHTQIKNYDGKTGLDIKGKTLEELEEQIIKYAKIKKE